MTQAAVQKALCEQALDETYRGLQQTPGSYLSFMVVPYTPNRVNPHLPWIGIPRSSNGILLPEDMTSLNVQPSQPMVAFRIGHILSLAGIRDADIGPTMGLPGGEPIIRQLHNDQRLSLPPKTRVYAPFAVEIYPRPSWPGPLEWYARNDLERRFAAAARPLVQEEHEINTARRRACAVPVLRRLGYLLSTLS